ncbi:hypothetical protein OnM2_085035 [Erysiphe neolycopersici]|uniref:Uncharacterized protein n=1 Tax=Erysiphe neolycopersici TaxID=212602 RepID=A0A420HES0_9PEZI|nr:hypothetical protein OnM2_085035 [Erysiphe neolycopersici]
MVKQNDGIAIILIVFLTFIIFCGLVACVLLARARMSNIEGSEAGTEEMANDGVEDEAGGNEEAAAPDTASPPPPPPAAGT